MIKLLSLRGEIVNHHAYTAAWEKIDAAQRVLNANRLAPSTLRIWIKWLDRFDQTPPGNDAFHLFQEHFLARFFVSNV